MLDVKGTGTEDINLRECKRGDVVEILSKEERDLIFITNYDALDLKAVSLLDGHWYDESIYGNEYMVIRKLQPGDILVVK